MSETTEYALINGLRKQITMLITSEKSFKAFSSMKEFAKPCGNITQVEEDVSKACKRVDVEISEEKKKAEGLGLEIEKYDDRVILNEKEKLEAIITNVKNEEIPSKEDMQALERKRKMLRLYKDITGIKWDYSAPENLIKGYVYGDKKNYVHAFEFPANNDKYDQLWQEIENASLFARKDLNEKENIKKDVNVVKKKVTKK